MFYHLEGIVTEFDQNLVVLDCGGIGFALNATGNTMSRLRTGERAKLYIAESIGENNFDLFGFAEKNEKNCFEMLVSVSGIGPKAALSILSYSSPGALALAVMNNDVKALTVAPGIGKKIAQRVMDEMLALRLAVAHNLFFYNTLTNEIRKALDEGRFASFRREFTEILDMRI